MILEYKRKFNALSFEDVIETVVVSVIVIENVVVIEVANCHCNCQCNFHSFIVILLKLLGKFDGNCGK